MSRPARPTCWLRQAALAMAAFLPSIVASSGPAHAQWAVFDSANFGQNVSQAARALQQIDNQLTSLQHEEQMLSNQNRNLTGLSYSSLPQLIASIQRTQLLLGQAQGMNYNVGNVQGQFQQFYPPTYTGATSSPQLIGYAQTRWQNTLSGYQDALQTHATVVNNLPTTQTQVSALVSSSQAATGALQATQSGNQLLALQSQQLADMTAVLAAQGRAQSLQGAQLVAGQEQAHEQLMRFLVPGPGYQPGNIVMFH